MFLLKKVFQLRDKANPDAEKPFLEHLEDLRAAGAAEVVPEVIEGSLMLASQTLAHIGIPLKRVIRLVQGQRMTRYALMRDVLKHKEGLGDVFHLSQWKSTFWQVPPIGVLWPHIALVELHTTGFEIHAKHIAIGKPLGQAVVL